MRLSGAARGPEWPTKTPKWGLQYLYCKAGISVRRLVLLAMKKYFNVLLDGWDWQQKNVIEMAVREQGAKARLRVGVLHFWEELFATVGVISMMCWTFAIYLGTVLEGRAKSRKKDIGEEFAFSSSLHCSSTNSICRGRGVVHGKVKSCFLQVAWQSIDGVFPFRGRPRRKVLCSRALFSSGGAC